MNQSENISNLFGRMTFNKSIMEKRLNQKIFSKLMDTIDHETSLDSDVANEVAHAMKEWALGHGATHFAHWFQPQRGMTAEKHDSFLAFSDDGLPIQRFSGVQLIQGEPDASSFPSGGMRSTFEARGYTAWDPTSPAFIQKTKQSVTLVIPSVFLSHTGTVLDNKTPFLRSLHAIEDSAKRLIKTFSGKSIKSVKTTIGAEQEFFLVNKMFLEERQDILLCGRTLIGGLSAKNQQMEDHYFGAIKPRVLDFMHDAEFQMLERGIPAKTRHNEVAPNQFEIAPIFEEANFAVDHNLQMMEILQQSADEHGFAILFHEKPFKGVNGSGKHMNWSLVDSNGKNLFEPSTEPKHNLQFLLFLSGLLIGVQKYGALLRAVVADAGNDHRLGANEAPPAIMSVYLGEYLSGLLQKIKNDEELDDHISDSINLGIKKLPQIRKDNTDRNRTSPMAFTGNKFEFRAVGSSQNVAEPAMVMNLIVAFGLDTVSRRLEKSLKEHKNRATAALAVIRDAVEETENVRFEGDNYGEAWEREAKKRGLLNLKTTPESLKILTQNDTIELFQNYGILNEKELKSKYDIKLAAYVKIKDVEMKILLEMAETMVLPALIRNANNLAQLANSLTKANVRLNREIDNISKMISKMYAAMDVVRNTISQIQQNGDAKKTASMIVNSGIAAMDELRELCDKAETIVEDNLWLLPKYREMLF